MHGAAMKIVNRRVCTVTHTKIRASLWLRLLKI